MKYCNECGEFRDTINGVCGSCHGQIKRGQKSKRRMVLTKTYEITKSSFSSNVVIKTFYSIENLRSTIRTGGLYEINDGKTEGRYYFTLLQHPVNAELSQIFENSMPLDGWRKLESDQEEKYILTGSWATEEEAGVFFKKIINFFEYKLKENNFCVKIENS